MIGIQYESQRLIDAYEEQETNLIFCPNGCASRRITVEFNLRWHRWQPCNQADMVCPICQEEMEF